jgi:hypothetical protein
MAGQVADYTFPDDGPLCFCKDEKAACFVKVYEDEKEDFVYFRCEKSTCNFMQAEGADRPLPGPEAAECRRCKKWVDAKITRKDGANNGRAFYSCRHCKCFQWATDAQAAATGSDYNA